MSELLITFAGQRFLLLVDRAIYWPMMHTLIVADLHIGKGAVFRARGLPVPAGTTSKDLARLSQLIEKHGVQRLLLLGDLLHAKESHDALPALQMWHQSFPELEIALVSGNHDRSAGALPLHLPISLLGDYHIEHGIAFVHDADDAPNEYAMAGHLHPVARLNDFDGSGVNVPCFVIEERRIILPAFGSFTGGWRIDPADNRRLFAAAAGRVIEVKPVTR